MKTVDIIIPVWRPDKEFLRLLDLLDRQTVKAESIILVNTEQKYFDSLIIGTKFWDRHKNVVLRHISKKEFNHGRTRNYAVKYSKADFFLMMTQDAMPKDEFLMEQLLRGMEEDVAVAYGRQLPAGNANPIEAFVRSFNYPGESVRKTREDIEKMGIKTYFSSNVCAMYRREIFDRLGGFVNRTIFNEDMIYACKAIQAGYGVMYCAEALVYHSHNYSNKKQFQRNFDLGVSHAEYPEVFEGLPAESEGVRLVKKALRHFRSAGKGKLVIPFLVQSMFRYAGYFLGKRYRHLPRSWVKAWSANREYWL